MALAYYPPTVHLDVPSCNLAEFLFSNPFVKGSPIKCIRESGSSFPRIPLDKKILLDTRGAFSTWSKLRDDVQNFAAGLREHVKANPPPLNPTHGQKATISPIVLIHLPNCLPYSTIKLGTLAAGYTVSPANPFLTAPELAHILNLSRPVVIITQPGPQGYDTIAEAIKQVKDYKIDKSSIFTVDIDNDTYGLPADKISSVSKENNPNDWKHLIHPTKKLMFKMSGEENTKRAAFILWSSGTSGKSKGVVLSHSSFISNLIQLVIGYKHWGSDEVFIGAVPGFHIFGLSNIFIPAYSLGAQVIIMKKFEPNEYFSLVEKHKATRLLIAPPIAVLLAKSPIVDKYNLSSVRSGMSGGAPLGPEVIEQVYKRLGILINMGYGLSETGGCTNQFAPTWEQLKPLLGSSGTVFSSFSVKIVSPEDGKVCKAEESGEICFKSPSIMTEYIGNKEATEDAIDAEGWYHTGDIGYIKDTKLYITDRLKEIIKVKGFQVSPAELEDYICGHPEIADAGVTSIFSNEAQTELPRAFVVPKNPVLVKQIVSGNCSQELLDLGQSVTRWVESRVIHYKWLRGGILFIDKVPKNPSGKILRRLLKDCKGISVDPYKNKGSRAKL